MSSRQEAVQQSKEVTLGEEADGGSEDDDQAGDSQDEEDEVGNSQDEVAYEEAAVDSQEYDDEDDDVPEVDMDVDQAAVNSREDLAPNDVHDVTAAYVSSLSAYFISDE